jgi:hypothetical protein
MRPPQNEYDPYYENYIKLVPGEKAVPVLAKQPAELAAIFSSLAEEQGTFAYAEGKWTIKELLSHLIDGERMFAYRVFRIARGDETPIEGFEQDGYIENSHANTRTFAEMLHEFDLLRDANILFFENLADEDWQRVGTANNARISVRALAFIMAGHITYHINVLHERYAL